MSKLFCISFFIACLLQLPLAAQPTLDTIQWCIKQKPQPFAKLDGRNAFFYHGRMPIFGIKGGVSYGKRLQLGIGYNQISPFSKRNTNFNKQVYYTNKDNKQDSVTARLRLFYFSACAEYLFYQSTRWHLSMPLQVGVGQTSYKYELSNKNFHTKRYLCLVYEPAVSIEYHILKWVGIGAEVGFRFILTGSKSLNEKLNSPTYAFNLLIFYGEIYKSLFPNSKWASRF